MSSHCSRYPNCGCNNDYGTKCGLPEGHPSLGQKDEPATMPIPEGKLSDRALVKVHRNDPCHCNSGKKYKNCHWTEDNEAGLVSRDVRSANKKARTELAKMKDASFSDTEKKYIHKVLCVKAFLTADTVKNVKLTLHTLHEDESNIGVPEKETAEA